MLHISLFSGIGGFDLAAQWAGWTNIVSCEINPFGNKVLNHYWPDAYHHTDIHTLTIEKINEELTKRHGANWRTNDVVLTGGFPCQPYSLAGKRLGKEDERHLWPEMLRVIQEVKPTWIVGENVFGLINWSNGLVFDEVQTDLETAGYEVQAFVLPACAADAPHRRDRVWIVAHAKSCYDRRNSGEFQKQNEQERKKGQKERVSKFGSTSEVFTTNTNSAPTKHAIQTGRNLPTSESGERVTTNTNGNGQQRSNGKHEVNASKGGQYAQRDAIEGAKYGVIAYANGKRLRRKSNRIGESKFTCKVEPPTDWSNFPTESPIRNVYDGISEIMERHIKPEIYATIKKTNTAEDLQKVWTCFQSEDVQRKIGGLYKIHEPSLLLKTMQLCSAANKDERGISVFSEEASKDLLRKLSKYGTFTNTPHGRELEKQFTDQFANTLPKLSHEIALVTMEAERASRKFAAWHRNESIKAAGNAIVPQIAFRIFETINQYNNQTP